MSNTTACSNCLTPLKGDYCYECGQSTKSNDRFFLTLVNEAFEDIFSMNSRVWKTLGNLLFRPGFLSQEYFAGRRVRYIPPIRLYFTLSILFFLIYSVFAFFNPEQTTGAQLIEARETAQLENSSQQPDKDEVLDEAEKQVNVEIPWLDETDELEFEELVKAKVKKAKIKYDADPGVVTEYFRDVAPPIIFCLLPLFALLLKLFYVFKGLYYTQHLVLAVHNHCFIFLWLILLTLVESIALKFGGIPDWIESLMGLWCTFYLWRSLRVVYQQGRIVTSIKFFLLAISYAILAAIAVAGAIVFGVMTL